MTNNEYFLIVEQKVKSLLCYCLDKDVTLVTSYDTDDSRIASALYTFKVGDYKCNFKFKFGIIERIDTVDDIASLIYNCSLSLKFKPDVCSEPIMTTNTITGSTFTSFNESITKVMKSFEDDVRRAVYEAKKNPVKHEDIEPVKKIDDAPSTDKLDVIIGILNDIKRLIQDL